MIEDSESLADYYKRCWRERRQIAKEHLSSAAYIFWVVLVLAIVAIWLGIPHDLDQVGHCLDDGQIAEVRKNSSPYKYQVTYRHPVTDEYLCKGLVSEHDYLRVREGELLSGKYVNSRLFARYGDSPITGVLELVRNIFLFVYLFTIFLLVMMPFWMTLLNSRLVEVLTDCFYGTPSKNIPPKFGLWFDFAALFSASILLYVSSVSIRVHPEICTVPPPAVAVLEIDNPVYDVLVIEAWLLLIVLLLFLFSEKGYKYMVIRSAMVVATLATLSILVMSVIFDEPLCKSTFDFIRHTASSYSGLPPEF
ncbi:MAG: hypothetical protein JJ921_18975 [Pseudomonadales bacterium]|nr:hypothetical protein [Pseudomonadales bacterium]MBO7007955.1 hypothetical protein [Pseudomonadales bacterium]